MPKQRDQVHYSSTKIEYKIQFGSLNLKGAKHFSKLSLAPTIIYQSINLTEIPTTSSIDFLTINHNNACIRKTNIYKHEKFTLNIRKSTEINQLLCLEEWAIERGVSCAQLIIETDGSHRMNLDR